MSFHANLTFDGKSRQTLHAFEVTQPRSTKYVAMLNSNLDVSEMFVERQAQRSSMHARHLNEQLVRVLKTIGYDVGFRRARANICSIATARAISIY